MIATLVAWLLLVFAGFGYRAPRHAVVVTTLLLAAASLLAGSVHRILDLDQPTSGPNQISPAPLERALAELQR